MRNDKCKTIALCRSMNTKWPTDRVCHIQKRWTGGIRPPPRGEFWWRRMGGGVDHIYKIKGNVFVPRNGQKLINKFSDTSNTS